LHTILEILHPLTALIRLMQGALYHYGPATLARHTMACAWLVCGLCLCVGGYEMVRGRYFDAGLWAGMAAILFTGFWLEATLSGGSSVFAWGAGAMAVFLLVRSLYLQSRAPAAEAQYPER